MIRTASALCIALTAASSCALAAAARPNIVLILADDLGYGDVGAYGGRFADTPNIDRLARQGVRFTHAYSPAPICSPSRAAILTGKSPARLSFEFVTKWPDSKPTTIHRLLHPPFTLDLPLAETTIAELLHREGYRTGIVGKWHVSRHHEHYLGYSPTHGPLNQGFDFAAEAFGSHPYSYKERDFSPCASGTFPNDAWADQAVAFLERNRERPFFLYAPTYYVHTPVHTRCRWLYEKYLSRWNSRDAPTSELHGMTGPETPEDAAMYGAFVETLDHQVGRVLDALNRLERARDTVVLFASDNGGHPQYASNRPFRGSKWNLYEGGVRTPLIIRRPQESMPGRAVETPVIGMDLFPTIAGLAGVEIPSVLDGVSLLPLLQGGSLERSTLTWHFPYYHPEHVENPDTEPQSAIRSGDWKLIYYYDSGRAELFDLREDPSEQRDLAASLPDKAAKLKQDLRRRLEAVAARFPTLNR